MIEGLESTDNLDCECLESNLSCSNLFSCDGSLDDELFEDCL